MRSNRNHAKPVNESDTDSTTTSYTQINNNLGVHSQNMTNNDLTKVELTDFLSRADCKGICDQFHRATWTMSPLALTALRQFLSIGLDKVNAGNHL
ncbi:hypothetical protein BWQ96_09277 [Gracilariopsis chorda]|uniref:Uncharacterized protein n=1 Tax=Gracilariopsis chorda TaxID=448386 RepID=A0A2V3IIR2_9FLOR|nr:hypothetical protein BWQ96_09277 [Gracilariopsis chorda]|eukprot:PXF41010.1 hypothetical protein BWQ96_09277 [Gracilariopsis chorda]